METTRLGLCGGATSSMKKSVRDRIVAAGNHLGLCLPTDHPPYTATYEEGLNHFGPGKMYEVWVAWKTCYEVFEELGQTLSTNG